jgi:hypothetical protein
MALMRNFTSDVKWFGELNLCFFFRGSENNMAEGRIANHRHFEALRMLLTHANHQKPTTLPQIISRRGAFGGA